MKINFKEYSSELAKDILNKVSAKAVKGEGEFEVVASTEHRDRHGEVVKQDGWDLKNYKKNPIILWGHDYRSLDAVVGVATDIKIEDKKMIIKGVFASTDSGQKLRKLYDDGIIKTVSVGFIAKERNDENPDEIEKAELLELSFVSVPANPNALSLAKDLITVLSNDSEDNQKAIEIIKANLNIVESKDNSESVNDEAEDSEVEDNSDEDEDQQEKLIELSNSSLSQLKKDVSSLISAYVKEENQNIKGLKPNISAKTSYYLTKAIDALVALKENAEVTKEEKDNELKKDLQKIDSLFNEVLKKAK